MKTYGQILEPCLDNWGKEMLSLIYCCPLSGKAAGGVFSFQNMFNTPFDGKFPSCSAVREVYPDLRPCDWLKGNLC